MKKYVLNCQTSEKTKNTPEKHVLKIQTSEY